MRVVGYSPGSSEMIMEAEDSPLLEAIMAGEDTTD
jgi:hypothetical protein